MPGTTAARLTWPQALSWRLMRQGVERVPAGGGAALVAHRLCGLHAQIMSSAEYAVGVRVPDLPPPAVRRALWDERGLVKTWQMRGTLHLLASDDLPTYVAASRLRRAHLRRSWLAQNKITAEQVDLLLDVVPRILAGACLTRADLAAEIARVAGCADLEPALRSGFGEILKPVAFHGGLCFGPNQGRHVTFMHPRDWCAGTWSEPSGDDALRAILHRFLGTHGPATPADFAHWWGGIGTTDAERVRAGCPDIVDVEVDGRTAWLLAEHLDEVTAFEVGTAYRLLPGFDPYIVSAPRDVEAVVAAPFRQHVYRFAGWFSSVVLAGPTVVGTWQHQRKRSGVQVDVRTFRPLRAAARRAIAAEADRFAALSGAPATVDFGQHT